MDDLSTSRDDPNELALLQKEVADALAKFRFTMTKWKTNETTLAAQLADSQTDTKILGIRWDPKRDVLSFNWRPNTINKPITMRKYLSEVQQLYDPMGLLSPVTIRARMVLQEMFAAKLEWDQTLPPHLQEHYQDYMKDLTCLKDVEFPRWLGIKTPLNLYGFSDASEKACAAVVYAYDGQRFILLASRNRVAPMKPTTIPRMELKGAVLLAELLHFLMSTMEVGGMKAFVDSMTVLAWLASGERQPVFIRNRVTKIHQLVPGLSWNFISGADNPADIPSRGSTLGKLMSDTRWWYGPRLTSITCLMTRARNQVNSKRKIKITPATGYALLRQSMSRQSYGHWQQTNTNPEQGRQPATLSLGRPSSLCSGRKPDGLSQHSNRNQSKTNIIKPPLEHSIRPKSPPKSQVGHSIRPKSPSKSQVGHSIRPKSPLAIPKTPDISDRYKDRPSLKERLIELGLDMSSDEESPPTSRPITPTPRFSPEPTSPEESETPKPKQRPTGYKEN